MTASFTDAEGNAWGVTVDVAGFRRVRSHLGINLQDLFAGDLAAKLADDVVLMVDILWCIVSPLANERGIDEEAFAALLDGDSIDDASKALLEGVVAFFPKRKRAVLTAALAKSEEAAEKMLDLAERKIEDTDLEAILAMSGGSSTNAPESSASTPDPSPSGS